VNKCDACGHIIYPDDLFDGDCQFCCDRVVAQLAAVTAERDRWKQIALDVNALLDEVRLGTGSPGEAWAIRALGMDLEIEDMNTPTERTET
jgi:hypothetical protein